MSIHSDADYKIGQLRPPRRLVSHSKTVTAACLFSIFLRALFIGYVGFFGLWHLEPEQNDIQHLHFIPNARAILSLMQFEMLVTAWTFLKWARWEDQGHLITLWQTMYTLEVLCARQGLYDDPKSLAFAFAGLYVTYYVGIFTEFTKREKVRSPPFCLKKMDTTKPKYGWLGPTISRCITNKWLRILITGVMYCVGLAFSIFMLYAFLVSEVDNLRHLPSYYEATQDNPETDIHALTPLLMVAIAASMFSMLPTLLVEFGAIPGLWQDLRNNKLASRSYRTNVWDVCELDEDKNGPGSDLKKQMEDAGKLLDITIVLPCFMPNEAEILPFVWDHYLKEFQKLQKYESEVFTTSCEKKILVVWNSPPLKTLAPDTQDAIHKLQKEKAPEYQQKFKEQGFELVLEEVEGSTSKCDNLNRACDLIKTEICCLNDADTMLDWSCMVRGSNHISNGIDIAQAMNSHCKYDCRGTPGDDEERQCHPYGILITIGDSTKPQNMSTQTPFKHAPFNGRGGFWKTKSLQMVGFDHRTVGEDHDAGYRGCAYFGMKGVLDMNMLCQEQEPPDCKALTSQRIRWETAALEMRRTFSWIIRSPHYGSFETFVLLWGQLQQNCNLPFQSLPFQVATALPLIILKGWVMIYAFGPVTVDSFCAKRDCVWSFHVTNPISGNPWIVALPLPLVVFVVAGFVFIFVNAVDFLIRVFSTRYRPRCMFFVYYGLLKNLFVVPYFVWVQYWALYDYSWGGAKFIATTRSPVSPKKEEKGGLQKPLLA